MPRCCREDGAVRDFRIPAIGCVDGGGVVGKDAVERGVPGIEGGRGNVAAVAAGVNTAGVDGDAASGEAGPWSTENRSNCCGDAALA